ncbi:hypothetical protein BDV96DRAFT_497745 [Lophiotrema nucula]|uniref:Uncharacterized protein n=1 Tax=Lophiotrema nucula TaxID=690887 RepID=A0A6A5Z057_9PLEO|nr:hypothetical protein BDV96DRAFT_497745 [Lophiotrema nucula]
MLKLRTYTAPQAEVTTTILARIIASFPQMMLRKETFPPFIHSASYDYSLGTQALPEVLTDCMGLAQMFATRTKESNNMFWRAIRMEQEKLYAQHESYSDHEMQAAVQAILIYIMMRLVDGRPEHDDVEIPLFHTLNTISMQLSRRIGGDEFKGALRYDEDYWQQWLFQETRRRVVAVARIMNIGFYLDRAISCKSMDGFSLIPLPSKKTLWEATNEQQWRVEYNQLLQDRVIHGLTTEGKLVGLRQANGRVQVHDVEWQKWYASQDGFGILVMLASQLLGS